MQEPQSTEFLEQQVEQASANLQQNLGIEDAQLNDISVEQVHTYENETIVRYVQSYRGVEIYGSSLVATSGDDEYFGGTYYDLSEAFGEDFSTLAEEAAQVPEWMVPQNYEGITVIFDTESLKPVVYITEENTAVVARCFTAEVSYAGKSMRLELLTNAEGTQCYHIVELNFVDGYRDTDVKSSLNDPVTIVMEDGVYYAYNPTYNFYAGFKVYESSNDIDNSDYMFTKNGRIYLKGSEDLVFSRDSKDWTKGNANLIIRAMQSYYDVADWYFKNFGYYCLDGQGGLGAVIVAKDIEDTVAYNDSNVLIVIEPDVTKAPEILVHEYGHTVFQMESGTYGKTHNQTAALKEALCDVFASVYLAEKGNDSWVIGEGANDPKNIPGTFSTMEDYIYDRSYEYANWGEVPYDMSIGEILKFSLFSGLNYELDSSDNNAHDNAYIISNTMYRIWKEEFSKDTYSFRQVFYRSLRYLPANPDFQDFRSAFVQATRLICGQSAADAAGIQFDKAGIYLDLVGQVQKIFESRQTTDYLLDYCTADYATIFETFRDSAYTCPDIYSDGGNVWNCSCMIGQGLGIVFNFASDYEDPNATPIYASIDDFMYWSGSTTGAELCPGLEMGMTYEEAARTLDMTELEWAPEQRWTNPVYLCYCGINGCALELYFIGNSEETAVLISVNVTPIG